MAPTTGAVGAWEGGGKHLAGRIPPPRRDGLPNRIPASFQRSTKEKAQRWAGLV
jgi:hypothetical protein